MKIDDIYKLVALGYSGKTNNLPKVLSWFSSKYGIYLSTKRLKDGKTEFWVGWKEGSTSVLHTLTSPNQKYYTNTQATDEFKVKLVLRAFRTVNGVVSGPSDENFKNLEIDWT
ncbi:MAG: hypothetical protein J6I84_03200 [Bacilli bacterium]|nr:hypothetical protein [Bacilli bacterium]